MRSGRRVHAYVVVATMLAGALALAQPARGPDVTEPAPLPPGVGTAPPTPAGTSAVESSDIPPWAPPPPTFIVAPFENRSGVRAFDWLVAAAPFEIATKTERVLGLEPANAPLFVGKSGVPPIAAAIPAFAAPAKATYVVTGWVERPNWELRLSISLWKVQGATATLVLEATHTGPVPTYHVLLGKALGDVWAKAGFPVDEARLAKLQRSLAVDQYAVTLMGRGLGHLVGALPPPSQPADPAAQRLAQLKIAEHDLERSVFIDPKSAEAQRLVGELYRQLAPLRDEPKLASRAAGKFAYAHDLAPDDPQALRAAAQAAADASKPEVARELFTEVVRKRRWDLHARYELGRALWSVGNAAEAEEQLSQVTARDPNHLPARRVLVLIHASRSETKRLATELEAIAARAPDDLEIKADLASAYGALGAWDKATAQLEIIAAARPPELALLVRIGDGHRKQGRLDDALAWYGKAQRLAPESSFAGFLAAQSLFDAGRFAEAGKAYNLMQKYKYDLAAAEQALGVIAYLQNRANEAAWYLRKATREAPRQLLAWRALIASELARKDTTNALDELARARPMWPRDPHLLYLAGIAHALAGERGAARTSLIAALDASPDFLAARTALGSLDAGGTVSLAYTPEIIRPWGDAEALQDTLDRFTYVANTMAAVRTVYQTQFLSLLGSLGKGPFHPVKGPQIRTCPLGRVTPLWTSAQQELRRYERLGVDLEAAYRYIARHDDAGVSASLLPNARTQLIAAKKTFKTALADVTELRSQWTRGLGPELKVAGCSDRLLAAAAAEPERYRVIVEDKPEAPPTKTPPRPRPRATFYVDNTGCPDPVDVWIDGSQLGEVAPGRRSALVAPSGERTLCLLTPGAAQCGDRGTVRQVYLHDGWSVTMHCVK